MIFNAITDVYFAQTILNKLKNRSKITEQFDNQHRAISACASISKRSQPDVDGWSTLICYDLTNNLETHTA
jgi:hypothetical protein